MTKEASRKVVATIEARMTSSRLPGKVLFSAAGEPMLMHLLRRLRSVPSIDEIVIATTTNQNDDPIVDFAKKAGVSCYRGSEDDVLGRVVATGELVQAEVLVEITGDCPIIDPDIVEQTIRMFFAHDVHYVSNGVVRSYPDGMDVQVMYFSALQQSATMTVDPLDREHVSRFIYQHPDMFSQIHLVAPPSLHWPELGLTLDEEKDYLLLKMIIEELAPIDPLFGCADILKLLHKRPDWVEINNKVVRKGIS